MAREVFIGRRAIIEKLKKTVFYPEDNSGKCLSLVGPNGIGKTALIGHIGREFTENAPPHVYYFATSMMDLECNAGEVDGIRFWRFWSALILRFSEAIPHEALLDAPVQDALAVKKIDAAYAFFDEHADYENESFKRRATLMLNDLFTFYTSLGIRIIITIDEFDLARTKFAGGMFFQRLFSLSPKGSSSGLRLSVITISRKDVSHIAQGMEEGSNFKDAYPPETLRGFDDAELNEYFDCTAKADGTGLTPEEKKAVLWLCGRSPGLLMRMREEIEDAALPLDIGRIYTERGGFIRTAYDRMCSLMNDEFIDKERTKRCMSIFIQYFIGPAYDEHLSSRLERLYEYGFITMTGGRALPAFGEEEAGPDGEAPPYEPLSPYLVDYIRSFYLPNELDALVLMLQKTELEMRRVILSVYRKRFPDSWEEEIDRIVNNPDKDAYLERLRLTAQQNDCLSRGIEVTKLDVLAFTEYRRLIRAFPQEFAAYFGDLDAELNSIMYLLNTNRNTGAHWNIRVLNTEEKRRHIDVCKRILSAIERGDRGEQPTGRTAVPAAEENVWPNIRSRSAAPPSSPGEQGEGAPARDTSQLPRPLVLQYTARSLAPDIASLIGTVVQVTQLKKKPVKKNVVGSIVGSRHEVSVPLRVIEAKHTTPDALVARGTISVLVVDFDTNAQKYIGESV